VSRFLLDTNVISEPMRPQPNQRVIAQLRQYESEMAIASVTWHELLFGCNRLPDSKKRQKIEQYLRDAIAANVPTLPYDAEAANHHASERSRLVALGLTPSFADGQIAAIAQVNNLILVTNNVADFANFQNLQIENWFA
jgi:tRNA(fMet)-specific endonuclease VapC